jgi:hypothetical protein
MMFMNSDVSGGRMIRKAIGSSTKRYVCGSVRPSAVPAIPWPRGSDWMPARTCSDTRAAVKKPRQRTAGTYAPHGGGICLIHVPIARGTTSGSTKYHRNIWTSSGMLRNSST